MLSIKYIVHGSICSGLIGSDQGLFDWFEAVQNGHMHDFFYFFGGLTGSGPDYVFSSS